MRAVDGTYEIYENKPKGIWTKYGLTNIYIHNYSWEYVPSIEVSDRILEYGTSRYIPYYVSTDSQLYSWETCVLGIKASQRNRATLLRTHNVYCPYINIIFDDNTMTVLQISDAHIWSPESCYWHS